MSNLSLANTNNVYYNAVITNTATNPLQILAKINREHQQPIIDDPTQYLMCVERFNIPGNSIPRFFFQDNAYSVTLTYGGNDYKQVLVYVPDNSDPSIDVYYNDKPIYYYQQFIASINNALIAAHLDLITANPLAPANPPVLIFNASTQLFSFIVPRDYGESSSPTVEIYFSYSLAVFFETIEIFYLDNNSVSGKDTYLVIRDNYNNYYPDPADPSVTYTASSGNTYLAYQFTSAYPYFRKWNQLRSLVITTASIPCRREIISTEMPYDASDPGSVAGANNNLGSNFASIVTDFTPQFNTNGDVLSTFYYYPQGPLRLIDLTDRNPLYRFDLQIFWTDTSNPGVLRPMYIQPGDTVSIKILFMKKTIFNFINANSF